MGQEPSPRRQIGRALFPLLATAVLGCSHGADHGVPPDGGSLSADRPSFAEDGPPPCAQSCTGVCIANQCIPISGPCVTDADCDSDFVCYCAAGGDAGACGGMCIPWGVLRTFDPSCGGQNPGMFPASAIELEQSCHWDDYLMLDIADKPVVGDLDHDGAAEIVFDALDPDDFFESGHLIAIHGADCSLVWDQPVYNLPGAPTLADLDGDGFPEIFISVGAPALATVLDHTGALVAQSDPEDGAAIGGAIANVDATAGRELLTAASVYRFQEGSATLKTLYSRDVFFMSGVSLFADMDEDGIADVVLGDTVLDALTGADKTPGNLRQFGNPAVEHAPAVADFNGDGHPDLAIVRTGDNSYELQVFDFANNQSLFGPYLSIAMEQSGGGDGGAPTVDDFDGDGVPDIAVAGQDSLCVYSLTCAQHPRPQACSDDGILWCKRIQDWSSGVGNSTSFDFNSDGIPEIVYRDECWLRIYEGSTGKVLYAQTMTSITGADSPVVADVDGDGRADLVVEADELYGDEDPSSYCSNAAPEADTNTPWSGAKHGVFVFRDPMNRWPVTRPIWSGHGYHITEINDDLTVPPHEKPSWLAHNTYRRNSQAFVPSGRLPDLTARRATSTSNRGMDCTQVFWVWARVCNRGAHAVAAGLPGTFYLGDPGSGPATSVCTATTTERLDPGTCQNVSCPWKSPPLGLQDLWFRIDDDGAIFPSVKECNSANDIAHLPATCNGGSM